MAALLVVSVMSAVGVTGCAGDVDDEAARERLAATSADAPSGSAAGTDGGEGAGEELEDVEVVIGPVADVDVRDNTFGPENIQVSPGARVVWTNNGRQDHDIVAVEDDGWGVEPSDFTPDAVYERVFDRPGTYRYYCSLHGTAEAGMTGAVVVE